MENIGSQVGAIRRQTQVAEAIINILQPAQLNLLITHYSARGEQNWSAELIAANDAFQDSLNSACAELGYDMGTAGGDFAIAVVYQIMKINQVRSGIYLNDALLVNLFKEGFSDAQIAERFETSRNVVKEARRRLGLKRQEVHPEDWSEEAKSEVKRLVALGWSNSSIAEHFNCTRGSIEYIKSALGLTVNNSFTDPEKELLRNLFKQGKGLLSDQSLAIFFPGRTADQIKRLRQRMDLLTRTTPQVLDEYCLQVKHILSNDSLTSGGKLDAVNSFLQSEGISLNIEMRDLYRFKQRHELTRNRRTPAFIES